MSKSFCLRVEVIVQIVSIGLRGRVWLPIACWCGDGRADRAEPVAVRSICGHSRKYPQSGGTDVKYPGNSKSAREPVPLHAVDLTGQSWSAP